MYPDVIYIGAPRAGSTWVWKNLSQHPDTWTLPYKAVEYLNNKSGLRRKKVLKYHRDEIFSIKPPGQYIWDIYYLLYPVMNDRWYQNLFRPGNGKLKIDMAPSCMRQPYEGIKHIYERMPEAKLLFAMRNPIDRTWSHAKQLYMRNQGRALSSISKEEFFSFFEKPNQFINSQYVDTIERWLKVYPEKQIFIYFFEDILQRPMDLLREICSFLDLPFEESFFEATYKSPQNFTGNRDIPNDLKYYLAEKYQQEIIKTHQKWGGPTDSWINELNLILNNSQ